VNADRLS